MNSREQNLSTIRDTLKGILKDSPWYLSRPLSEQIEIYRDLLVNGMEALENGNLSQALAQADDTTVTTIQDVPELTGDFLEEVDFPKFVTDLINGVYGSIVTSSINQMMAYADFFKQLAKPLGALAREVDDIDAKAEVASGNPMRFTMSDKGDLVDNDSGGITLDESNDEYNRMVFEAKLKIARERRLILRETMLMGVQRLIVTDGVIRASLIFNIKATEASQAGKKTTNIERKENQFGGGFLGFFGGGNAGSNTKITVSSTNVNRNTELMASITGFVEVKFKSDVFELNNFTQVFASEGAREVLDEGQAQRKQNQPGTQPAPASAGR